LLGFVALVLLGLFLLPGFDEVEEPGTAVAVTKRAPASEIQEMSPISQAAVAFKGGHSASAIKSKLDEALPLYGLVRTDENYSRAGSALVVLRKEYGVEEMRILDHMIRSHVPGVSFSFPDAAGISVAAIVSGDL
jgi:hypothetical protein